ncbi:hypothetical protein [Gimesia maris]|uniref:hypothetical protein n=1 Tax=Gimesia maris TaxID=122 RepID=UPI0018D6B5CF|nr:hypothetical protein [Gimesia maris]
MESHAGAVRLEAVRSWLIVWISFGLQSDVTKKESEKLGFEKWGDSTGVSAARSLRHHLYLLLSKSFDICLRQAEKLMQIESRKNRRR